MSNTTYAVGVRVDGSAAGLAKTAKEAKAHLSTIASAGGKEFMRMAQAREALGIRSEKRIQQEIARTQAAYQRLAASGTLSWHEQRRAAAAMRTEVEKLTNEMGRLTTRQQIARGLRWTGAGIAGIGAAGAILKPKVETAMAYDLRLRHLANTAYALGDDNRLASKTTRQAGIRELDESIMAAVRYGGGTRDKALDALNQFVAVNQFSAAQIKGGLLKETMLAATANDVAPELLANLANKAIPGMGLQPERVGRMYGMATFAGQRGGFELKDMAMHLPEQMPFAKALGMQGEKDFAKILALNQAAFMTAGTPDQAGVNVKNLLEQLSQKHTTDRFKKIGIDLPRQIAEGRLKGLDALDVVSGLLDKRLEGNKNYKNLQYQVSQAKDGSERKAALESMLPILQATEIGKVIHEQRALLGLAGLLNYKDLVKDVAGIAPQAADAHSQNFDLIKDAPSFKAAQAANEQAIAMQRVMDQLTPTIGTLADNVTSLMQQYPGYTTAVVGATTALTALAGAAGGVALLSMFLNKTPGVPGGGLPGRGLPKGGAPGTPGRLGMLGKLGALGAVASTAAGLFWTSDEEIAILKAAEAKRNGSAGTPGSAGGSSAAVSDALRAAQIDGEVRVLITAPPGFTAQATTSTNSRVSLSASVGQTNLGAGQ